MKFKKRPHLWSFWIVFLAVLILSNSTETKAMNVKLSGVLPPFGDVNIPFEISPDGRYAVYKADQNTDGVFDIFSVQMDGGLPVRLNPLLPAGRKMGHARISSDSRRVVYQADQETAGMDELYSVPIGGPAEAGVKISGPLTSGGKVIDFWISPNGLRVVYLADQEEKGVYELYSVPIEISKVTSDHLADTLIFWKKLNGPLIAGGNVLSFQISPDSQWVVYLADQDTDDVNEVYSVPIEGPEGFVVKLNKDLVAGGDVNAFIPDGVQISPDSIRVIYIADQQINGQDEVYSVPIRGSADSGVRLNGPMAEGGDVISFRISPDGQWVVYLADQDAVKIELFSVPIEGPFSYFMKLNAPLVIGGDVCFYRISPDSQRVVYLADQEIESVNELYGVPIRGLVASVIKLNGPLTAFGEVFHFQISPDSRRVLYLANQENVLIGELYSVPGEGPSTEGIKLNGPLVAGGVFPDLQISPDSARVVYRVKQIIGDVWELYSVPTAGPASSGLKCHGPLTANGSIQSLFRISPDSRRVLYVADQETDEMFELYMTFTSYVYLPLIVR